MAQDTLLDNFERIETFFRRLEVYTEVEPTPEMMVRMAQISVEVLSILGIATKEIKQGRTSEHFTFKRMTVDRMKFRKIYEEAYRKD